MLAENLLHAAVVIATCRTVYGLSRQEAVRYKLPDSELFGNLKVRIISIQIIEGRPYLTYLAWIPISLITVGLTIDDGHDWSPWSGGVSKSLMYTGVQIANNIAVAHQQHLEKSSDYSHAVETLHMALSTIPVIHLS